MAQQKKETMTQLAQRKIMALKTKFRIPFYNIGYRMVGSLDGHALPPAHLVDLVIGTREVAWYQLGGLFMHQAIATILRRHDRPIESFHSMLDFGCGCGRIVRWWAALQQQLHTEIWGCDYNPLLVKWCQKNLSDFANFKVNQSDPPLDFPDGKFEFVYAYSVFTHFARNKQDLWLKEMVRVTKNNGLLLLTVHGKRAAWRMGFSVDQFQQLEEQGIMVFGEERSGANYCSAYHSEKYMSNLRHIGLELLEFMPGGVRDSSEQDMYLYRKIGNVP